ncbi:Uncharacterised protein [uncultured archaeon]|nr:Uncharacterised protein [uncultured archaeon]
MLISPAGKPKTTEDTITTPPKTRPAEDGNLKIRKRRGTGKTINSIPIPMNVHASIPLISFSRFSLSAIRGAATSNEEIKIKSGTMFRTGGEKRDGRNIVIRTRMTINPVESTMPHAAENIDFLENIYSIFLNMDIHLVKGDLYALFPEPYEHLS